MKFYFNLITALIFFSMTTLTTAQSIKSDSLTLQNAINLTLTNQPLLQQALEEVSAAQARINQQKTFDYPDVRGNFTYTRVGPIPSIQFGEISFELTPANNYNASITASQIIYDFGKRDALIDLAASYKLSAEDKISLIKNDLSYQTVKTFYAILFLEKSIEVKNEQIKTLNKHIEMTNKKVSSGSATDFDILTTKVRVASAENQKIDLQNALNKAKIYLRNLFGWSSDKELNLKGEFKLDSSLADTVSLIKEAFEKRPEMKLALDAQKSAVISKQAASLSETPILSIAANYGFKNGYEPNLDVLRGNWAAGIVASVPIFNGNLKEAKVEEAEANIKSSSAGILQLERKIKIEVEQATADLNAARSKIKIARLQIEQAKQAVSRAEIQYVSGVITNLDLIDAETALSEAELMQLNVLYENIISTYSLYKAIGKIIY